MTAANTSFMIPNGTVEAFDQALGEAVPEAELLNNICDDNGYVQVISALETVKHSARLPC